MTGKDNNKSTANRRNVLQGIGAAGGLAVLGTPLAMSGIAQGMDGSCTEVSNVDCGSFSGSDCPEKLWKCSDK
ncbi:twin-arginine translocation signal domain-containing protein [Haladaptatus cibarius]|uniref:twin-arginine translocation signal domain-containing protein n=1 Tax=Haladaptatus cibarius TaxID=453847 RepID=UPI0009FDB594|nr:twin-arginine translocation signal domain-containing protein [Haladaptatus cibarius]